MTTIHLTPAASKFITRIVRFSGAPEGAGFRLQVSAGGCSGYNSEFSVEAAPLPGDSVLDIDGIKLFLNAGSRLLLQGVTIDFSDTPLKSGLTFINPAQTACACSSSGSSDHQGHSHAAPPAVASIALNAIRRH